MSLNVFVIVCKLYLNINERFSRILCREGKNNFEGWNFGVLDIASLVSLRQSRRQSRLKKMMKVDFMDSSCTILIETMMNELLRLPVFSKNKVKAKCL